MPGLNRTGPLGEGPGTGRRRGRCFGFGSGSGENRGWFGLGRMRGRGFCRMSSGPGRRGFFPDSQEKEMLLEEKSWLEQRLSAIRDRLSSLGS